MITITLTAVNLNFDFVPSLSLIHPIGFQNYCKFNVFIKKMQTIKLHNLKKEYKMNYYHFPVRFPTCRNRVSPEHPGSVPTLTQNISASALPSAPLRVFIGLSHCQRTMRLMFFSITLFCSGPNSLHSKS